MHTVVVHTVGMYSRMQYNIEITDCTACMGSTILGRSQLYHFRYCSVLSFRYRGKKSAEGKKPTINVSGTNLP